MKKKIVILSLAVTAGLFMAYAGGWQTDANQIYTNRLKVSSILGPDTVAKPPPQYEKVPVPLALDAAYNKAILAMGYDTNRYYCRSATCLTQLMTHLSLEGHFDSGWTFVFSDTNGVAKNVYVYFDKASTTLVEDPNHNGF